MVGPELLVPLALGDALRSLHESLRAIGVLLKVHVSLLGTEARPIGHGAAVF